MSRVALQVAREVEYCRLIFFFLRNTVYTVSDCGPYLNVR